MISASRAGCNAGKLSFFLLALIIDTISARSIKRSCNRSSIWSRRRRKPLRSDGIEDMAYFAATGGVLVGCRSGKIKENVDMPDLGSLANAPKWQPAAPISPTRYILALV